MSELEHIAALLRVVLGHPDIEGPRSEEWDDWVTLARRERVVPLLFHLVDTVPTDLTDEQRAEIVQLQGATLSRCVQLEHHLVAAVRMLADGGIRVAVLKGGATAHLEYPDPSWREVSDIDLLVEPAERIAATAIVEGAGWVQGYALPGGHDVFTHAVTFVRDQAELDLHQRIGRRALGLLIPTRELLDRATSFEIAGSRLCALGDADRLIHSAIHMMAARAFNRRLSSVADVLLGADRQANSADEVLAQAEHWRVRAFVERAVVAAFAAARLDMPLAWVDAMQRPTRRRDRWVERAYLDADRHPFLEELAYLRLLEGWGNRWRYTRGYFATDPQYATQHGRSGLTAQVRYVIAKLRSRSS